jgi:hypothetical protein
MKINKKPLGSKRRKSKGLFQKIGNGALDYVRSFDEYGQPISLNY